MLPLRGSGAAAAATGCGTCGRATNGGDAGSDLYDPKTAQQLAWRTHLAAASKAYHEALSEEQRRACIAAGAKRKTRPRLGQSGRQTGQQYWVGGQCKGGS